MRRRLCSHNQPHKHAISKGGQLLLCLVSIPFTDESLRFTIVTTAKPEQVHTILQSARLMGSSLRGGSRNRRA